MVQSFESSLVPQKGPSMPTRNQTARWHLCSNRGYIHTRHNTEMDNARLQKNTIGSDSVRGSAHPCRAANETIKFQQRTLCAISAGNRVFEHTACLHPATQGKQHAMDTDQGKQKKCQGNMETTTRRRTKRQQEEEHSTTSGTDGTATPISHMHARAHTHIHTCIHTQSSVYMQFVMQSGEAAHEFLQLCCLCIHITTKHIHTYAMNV